MHWTRTAGGRYCPLAEYEAVMAVHHGTRPGEKESSLDEESLPTEGCDLRDEPRNHLRSAEPGCRPGRPGAAVFAGLGWPH